MFHREKRIALGDGEEATVREILLDELTKLEFSDQEEDERAFLERFVGTCIELPQGATLGSLPVRLYRQIREAFHEVNVDFFVTAADEAEMDKAAPSERDDRSTTSPPA